MDALLGPAEPDCLHVMTYNVRYPANDPNHLWEDRRTPMAELLSTEGPVVVGIQEAHYHQLRDLVRGLSGDYAWIGSGREGGSHGEFSAILYDEARLEPVEFADLWLSGTPQTIGSTSWGNVIPRMATWVRFRDLATERELVVLNTHLDHASEPARQNGADLLASVVDTFGGLPTVVTGDFNAAAESSAVYDRLVSRATLADTWRTARHQLTPAYRTYGGYRDPVVGDRIDWILVSPGITVEAAAINANRFGGRFPSDHLPVQAHIRLD